MAEPAFLSLLSSRASRAGYRFSIDGLV